MGLETPKERISLQEAFESCRNDQDVQSDVTVTVAEECFIDLGPDSKIKLPAGETLHYLLGHVGNNDRYFVVQTSSGLWIQMPSSAAKVIQVAVD